MKPMIAVFCTVLAFGAQAGELINVAGDREGRQNHSFMYEQKDCKSCHQDGLKQPAPEAACMTCHGTYEELAKATEHHADNPHNSPHWGPDIPCTFCHSEHKPAQNWCAECHDFEYPKFTQ